MLRSRFVIDSGDPRRDAELSPEERRSSVHGILYFEVDAEGCGTCDTVDFGELLFWIEPEIDQQGKLRRLTILSTADFVGVGELAGTLRQVPASSAEETHWRVEIDPSSVSAPPVAPRNTGAPDFVPVPDVGRWRGGAGVRIHRGHDSSVRTIDLTIRSREHSDQPDL